MINTALPHPDAVASFISLIFLSADGARDGVGSALKIREAVIKKLQNNIDVDTGRPSIINQPSAGGVWVRDVSYCHGQE
jgi:hypothetical protein